MSHFRAPKSTLVVAIISKSVHVGRRLVHLPAHGVFGGLGSVLSHVVRGYRPEEGPAAVSPLGMGVANL